MVLILLPFSFLLWYLAYDAKPSMTDELGLQSKEKELNKRLKLINLINKFD